MRHAALVLIFAFLFASPLVAQPPSASDRPAVQASDPVPVPQPSEKALRYYRSGNVLWAISTLWSLAVPALLLFTGLSARMRNVAKRIGRNWFFTTAVYAVLFILVLFILDLPLSWYSGFVRQHEYGLSNQTAAKWWGDSLKGLVLVCGFGALSLWFPYLLMRKSPRRWWLYTGLATIPLTALLLLITPVWIEPRFNDIGPMKDKALEARILTLADRAGIEGSRVFEVDKSVDTKTVNAYVTGFMNTKRIVLWDTLLAKLDDEEVLSVMGHEMGHYVLGHVAQIIVLTSALVLFGLWVIHRTAGGVIASYKDRFGFTELPDVASVPLMALLFSVVTLVLSPIPLAVSRHNEHESDRFALEITRDNHACAMSFAKLQEENLSIPRPGPLYKLLRSTHPPLGERIDFCNDYRPWETGQPLKYADEMRPAS